MLDFRNLCKIASPEFTRTHTHAHTRTNQEPSLSMYSSLSYVSRCTFWCSAITCPIPCINVCYFLLSCVILSSAASVLFNSARKCNGTCFSNILSVACLYSVCFPFIFHLFSFAQDSFLLMCLLLSYIYSFSLINSSIFDLWFLFSLSSVVVTKIVLSFFSRSCLYIFFPPFLRTTLSSPPLLPRLLPRSTVPPLLRRNGHPFLLAFVTHSCVLLWRFTVDVPSHPSSRHLTTELAL